MPIGQVDEQSLSVLKEQLPEKLSGAPCRITEMAVSFEESLDPRSGQYYATKILAAMQKRAKDVEADRLLGVTDLDLYAPNMNFIFGEARLPGRVAIISTHRLRGTTDCGGLELFPARVIKEAVHELGHTLGLAHCVTPTCVMYFSNSLTDTDRKSQEYCERCHKKLGIEG